MYRSPHRAPHRVRTLLVLLGALVVLCLLVWPFVEPLTLSVEQTTLVSPSLPQDIGQLRIVYLSDIHYGEFYSMNRVKELVTKVNSLSPDLILLGGDYASSSEAAIAFFEQAPAFHARYAVCAVLGNNDRTLPESNLAKLQNAMYEAGITPLVNQVAKVKLGASSIYVAGIDDVNNGWPDVQGVAAQVSRDDYVIFLSHSPAAIAQANTATDKDGYAGFYDLALCGHTHGGQVNLLGNPLWPSAKTSGRYWHGWYEMNRASVLVSNGVGTSVLPIRVGAQPQIHQITVKYGR